MLEKHNRKVKITSHNHNQLLLPYKLAEQLASGLGRFIECWKCNMYISYNTCRHWCFAGYMHLPSGTVCMHQAKHSSLCYKNNLKNYEFKKGSRD